MHDSLNGFMANLNRRIRDAEHDFPHADLMLGLGKWAYRCLYIACDDLLTSSFRFTDDPDQYLGYPVFCVPQPFPLCDVAVFTIQEYDGDRRRLICQQQWVLPVSRDAAEWVGIPVEEHEEASR